MEIIMKRSVLLGTLAAGMIFSTQAFAETSSIDLFVGNFMGIGSVDTVKLAANKMIDDAITKNAKQSDVQDILNALNEYGIDYKKDIGMITVATTENGDFCLAVDAKKSLKDAMAKYVKGEGESLKNSTHKDVTIYTDADATTMALVSDMRLVACDKGLDIKPIIDNAKAAKPKLLKDRDSVLYNAYNATPKAADIRVGVKMTKSLSNAYGQYAIDDGADKKIHLSDVEAASLSINLSKGLNVEIMAQIETAKKAAAGEAILTKQIVGLLSDPTIEQLGLGFLSKAVKFSANKTQLKGVLNLSDDQITTISMLFMELAAGSASAGRTTTSTAIPEK